MKNYFKIEFECLCNLDCSYCPSPKFDINLENVLGNMQMIFSKINPHNSCIRVEGIGEITLYPEIIDFLNNKVKKEGYLIEVVTNGINCSQFISKNNALHWLVSLDGHTVEMNSYRNLSKTQIDEILHTVIKHDLEIQMVYNKQTIEEMNAFINILKSKNYKGFLHITPCRANNRLDGYLDYDKLIKTNFIPSEEYFNKWKYIYENKNRNFVCDFLGNGYVYRIMQHDEGGIRGIKCDCAGGHHGFTYKITEDSIENTKYSELDCGTCINHNEYNNSRKIMQ